MCVHGRDARSSPAGSTPTRRRRSTLAAAPDSPYEGGRRRTSTEQQISSLFLLHYTSVEASAPKTNDQSRDVTAGFIAHLDLHALGLDDVDLVLVAAPDLVVDHSHAADGVMRPAEVH